MSHSSTRSGVGRIAAGIFGLCMIAGVAVSAQTVATGSQSFAFDYKDADLTASSVVRFEMQIDTGAWTSVQILAKANDAQTPVGSSTYVVPIPALTTGNHTVSFRACNASLCGDGSSPFAFVLAVKPATPSGVRIK